jgi:hypothetical protein
MHSICQPAVVIHRRASIDDNGLAETGSHIDHGTGEHHGPRSNLGAVTEPGPWMNQ